MGAFKYLNAFRFLPTQAHLELSSLMGLRWQSKERENHAHYYCSWDTVQIAWALAPCHPFLGSVPLMLKALLSLQSVKLVPSPACVVPAKTSPPWGSVPCLYASLILLLTGSRRPAFMSALVHPPMLSKYGLIKWGCCYTHHCIIAIIDPTGGEDHLPPLLGYH